MSPRPNIHRSDLNSPEIIDALRQMGVFVYPLGRPTDLLCGISGLWLLMEIKSENGTYTEDQEKFLKQCETFNMQVITLRSVDDAVAVVNHVRRTDYLPVPF